ncbi:unnamed protein product [Arabidopsis lyrata]|uniref:Myb-like domain-containing protein n=1 Tax=Arabidopsis lyrata subsp. lyrata TaxID=81972 RepID=D7MJ00_ARALL|nr:RNA polymerase I termination factor [Arabidopsis lyrata subsp. lyrata]EFH44878.1 hypothetical protein ARALYDRAFT_916116 [Arabidopsis lyrata subsp. lyrata]CAH8277739.1 unnamed protein product [Arabidopsis lyrata]|eukprot:XP_002868619.1 RNA polymerase I termination factor [Arabidopsis lyrata subsp. lyrata]
MAEEKKKKKSDTRVDSGEIVEEIVSKHTSMKKKEKKKKNRESKDGFAGEDEEIAGRGSEKLGEDVVKKKSKDQMVVSEADDALKKKIKETKVDSEAEDGVKKKKKKKKSKKESGSDVIGNSESSKVCETPFVHIDDADKRKGKRKRDDCDLGAEENTDKEVKRKKSKKKKQSVDSEFEDNNLNSTEDGVQVEDSEVEENNKDSVKEAENKQSVDSEAEEIDLSSTKDAKKKRKKKQESVQSDKDVTTPSSKSTKRVKFSAEVEFFPSEDEETEDDEEEVTVVRGKRYTKEEDELVKNAVLEYIDNHALGEEGIKMVMDCKSHPQLKGCWKEIASALPWRANNSVYNRAHTIFEAGSKGTWAKEDIELVMEFQKKHGNDWRTLADAMGKHRKHVKDAWRRGRLAEKKKGHWMREEYQKLFDLVNKDLRMKAFQEKHSKHGMLKDNIPWMAISDVLGTRDHVTCCSKWYEQLMSPMVAKGMWANVDDYRLLEELLKLDAACIDDVDWDNLLENRDGEACRKRWNQMIIHIGVPKSKTFAEQVEILSERYCPDIAEDREDFDNRPYDPED